MSPSSLRQSSPRVSSGGSGLESGPKEWERVSVTYEWTKISNVWPRTYRKDPYEKSTGETGTWTSGRGQEHRRKDT